MKKKLIFLTVLAILIYGIAQKNGISIRGFSPRVPAAADTLQSAFKNRRSNLQVRGKGVVIKVLRDDLKGSRHQRFILRLRNGQKLLVTHNIDLAPKISRLRKGDTIKFYGEYEWNAKGGVLHWTHRDPSGRHLNGWLKYKGKMYQ